MKVWLNTKVNIIYKIVTFSNIFDRFYLGAFFQSSYTGFQNETIHTVYKKWFENYLLASTDHFHVGGLLWASGQPLLVGVGSSPRGRSWSMTQTALPDNNTDHRAAGFSLAVCCGAHHQQTAGMNFSFVCLQWCWPLAQLTWSAYWWRSKTDNLNLCLDKNTGCVSRSSCFHAWLGDSGIQRKSVCVFYTNKSKDFKHHCSVGAINKKKLHYLLPTASEVSTKQYTGIS